MTHSIITLRQLVALLDPQEYALGLSDDLALDTFLTDSRSLVCGRGTIFVAIRTASGDGHRYIEELYERGVRVFLLEDPIAIYQSHCPQANFIRVASSVAALQRVAGWHRQHFEIPVVGITGSNGKTIVKEFLYTLLNPIVGPICRSPRSYNSQIGVPLSLLQINLGDRLAIIEAGISQPGEMQRLANIIAPTLGVLTSIGSAHAEHLGSRSSILEEKTRLFASAECIIAPLDDPAVQQVRENQSLGQKPWQGWSRVDPSALVYLRGEQRGEQSTTLFLDSLGASYQAELPMLDEASVCNAMTALSVIASLYPDRLEQAIDSLPTLRPVEMRLEVKQSYRGNTIINDAYTNDLHALRIALDFQHRRAQASGAQAVVVLSDIEQSSLSESELYDEVARLLEHYHIQKVYTVGEAIKALDNRRLLVDLQHFESTQALLQWPELRQLSDVCILIKGARRFGFEQIYRELSRLEHQTILEVDLSSVRHNLAHYRALLPAHHPIICMIKANGYGIGSLELARTLQDAGVDYLAVAVADEGKMLRQHGVSSRILVMNPELSSCETLFRYELEPEVYSLSLLRGLVQEAERLGLESRPIHLKIDSGMHRLGFSPESDLLEAIYTLQGQSFLRIESVFSHLAAADEPQHDTFTHLQAQRLQQAHLEITQGLGYRPKLHLLNTSGIERFAKAYAFDMVRLGIGLYGSSSTVGTELKAVARLYTTILQIKQVPPGDSVGYGRRGVTERARRIAIIPIGYADGLRRTLGNGAWQVEVHGVLCPTVGNICMDTCMIDVSEVDEVREGDRVILFGSERRTLEQLAEAAGTISYEILTALSHRIQRVYYQE